MSDRDVRDGRAAGGMEVADMEVADMEVAGFSPRLSVASDSTVTSATNVYPRRGTVLMYSPSPSAAPSAFRNVKMLTERLPSSTNVSGQTLAMSSFF